MSFGDIYSVLFSALTSYIHDDYDSDRNQMLYFVLGICYNLVGAKASVPLNKHFVSFASTEQVPTGARIDPDLVINLNLAITGVFYDNTITIPAST